MGHRMIEPIDQEAEGILATNNPDDNSKVEGGPTLMEPDEVAAKAAKGRSGSGRKRAAKKED